MVIFHSYVSLPEGNHTVFLGMSLVTQLLVQDAQKVLKLTGNRDQEALDWLRRGYGAGNDLCIILDFAKMIIDVLWFSMIFYDFLN